jgi:hypothetical protein
LNGYQGFAKITVHYETPRSDEGANASSILIYRKEYDSETVRIPGGDLAWLGNSSAAFPADAEGNLILPVTIHRLAWHQAVNPPWTAIRACQGKLNAGEFLGIPAGLLLFEGAKAARDYDSLSELNSPQPGWQLEYRFREKPLIAATTPPVFETADYSGLLQI